jgi:hypothetical protein
MNEIQWRAPEYEYYPKSLAWFWGTIIIAILFLILSILQKNFLFSVFIIISEILILIWASFEPKIINFKINNEGISVGENNFYNFDTISSFSSTLSVLPDLTEIKINFKNKLSFNISILIPTNIVEDVKKIFYEKNIPEVEHEEHFIDSLQKILKF